MITQKTENFVKILARGGIIIFTGSIIGKVFRFLFFICLIRVLGASLYGLYSIGQSIVDILTNIGLLGDGKGFIRFAAGFHQENDTPRLRGMIKSYIFICLALSSIIAITLFLNVGYLSSRVFHSRDLAGVLKIFALSFPFYIFSLIVIPIGFAFQKVEYKVIIQELAQPVINIIAVIIIFFLGARLYGAVAAFFISSVITAILGFYLLKGLYPKVTPGSKAIFEIKKLVVYSLPIIGILFCYYLLFRLDRIILGMYRTPFEVGIYSAASNTAICILVFSGIFDASFLPVITQLYHNNDNAELKRLYNCLTMWVACIAFIPCLILIIFNKEVVSLFGRGLNAAEPVLVILSISFFIDIIYGQGRQLLQMSSHQNTELVNSLAMIILNVALNLILIPSFGIMGAAFAFLFTKIAMSVVRTTELRVIFGFIPFNSRYLKFLAYVIFSMALGILTLTNSNIVLKSTMTVFIFLIFILIIYKLRLEEDVIVWNLLKSKLAVNGFMDL